MGQKSSKHVAIGLASTSWAPILFAIVFSIISLATANAQEGSSEGPGPFTTSDPQVQLDSLKVMVKPLDRDELQVEADAWFELLKAKARQIAVVSLSVKKTNEAMEAEDAEQAASTLQVAEEAKKLVDQEAARTEESITQSAQDNLGVEANSTEERPGTGDEEPPAREADLLNVPDNAADRMKNELLFDITELQDQRTALSDRLAVVVDSLESKGGEVEVYRQYITAVSGVELDTSDAEATWFTLVGWLTSKEGGQRWGWNLARFTLILLVAYVAAKLLATVVNWLLERKINLSRLAERLIANTIKNVFMLVGFAVALTALEIDVAP